MATFLIIFLLFPQVDLWQKCAELFDPPATYLQCRKYFEQKRTAFGKIETFEMRSGSAARERTAREEEIMETWSFLKGHIAHIPTIPSQIFSSGQESSSSDTSASGLSAHSVQRRRAKKKRAPETSPAASTSNAPRDMETERNRVIGSLLEQASKLTAPPRTKTMGEMYGNIIGQQLSLIETDDLLPIVSPMLTYIMQCSAAAKRSPMQPMQPPPLSMASVLVPPVSLGAPTPAPMPPAQQQMVPPHAALQPPSSAPSTSMQPPPPPPARFQMPAQEHSIHYPMPSTSGYQPQPIPVSGYQPPASPVSAYQPPASPVSPYQPASSPVSAYQPSSNPVSAYQAYPAPLAYTSGYQVPVAPVQSRAQQHPTGLVYTPISGAASSKPAPTQTSPSKRQFLEGLDNISLSPYCAQTPSPITAAIARAMGGGSEVNTPASKADEEENDDE